MSWTAPPRGRNKGRPTLLALASYASLVAFIAVFLLLGLLNNASLSFKKKHPQYDFPDFDRIDPFTRVLNENNVGLDDPQSRIIFMGDVHGMDGSLHELMSRFAYDPDHDTIFFAGDLLAKSSHSSSLSVLHFLTKHHIHNGTERIFAVRGNHDHMIVQWRAWREWFEALTIERATPHSPRLLSLVTWEHPMLSPFRRFFAKPCPAAVDSIAQVMTGREFLQLVEAEWAIARSENDADPEEYTDVARKRAEGTWREEWWRRIPQPGKGREKQQWRMFGDHYWLARDMTQEQADYLFSLPLVLHVPHMHLFVVHAGLLPSDPRLAPTDQSQPLAHAPTWAQQFLRRKDLEDRVLASRLRAQLLAQDFSHSPTSDVEALHDSDSNVVENMRQLQETAILTDVPQNRDPWVVLNMRSVTKKHKVTRDGEKGTPWSKIWNEEMNACKGYGIEVAKRPKSGGYELPCHPATVVYGHAASRGLDIKRWSMGLDTGCLYGRELTALVLSNATKVDDVDFDPWYEDDDDDDDGDEDEDEEQDEEEDGDAADSRPRRKRLQFGDRNSGIKARLVSVDCPNGDDIDG